MFYEVWCTLTSEYKSLSQEIVHLFSLDLSFEENVFMETIFQETDH
jgi:hypothetical protein